MLGFGKVRIDRWIMLGNLSQLRRHKLGGTLAMIGDRVGSDTIEPCGKRCSTPFEAPKILKCVMKNIGGKILRLLTIMNSFNDECVHALEIVLVQLGEAGRITLRGLDNAALWRLFAPAFQCGLSSHLRL